MATTKTATGGSQASAAVAVADPTKESFSFSNPLDSVDENRKLNLLLFLVLLVVFGFGLYCYSRVGLDFGFVCDALNANQTLARVISPEMLMFAFLFSLSVALSAFASRGLPKWEAAGLSAIVSLLPAIGLGITFPSYIYPFIGFASAVIAASYFASGGLSGDSASFSDAYSVVGRSMFVFTIVACLLSLVAVSQNRDQYFGEFFSGLADSSSIIMAQGAGVLSKVVTNFQVTPSVLEGYMSRDDVRKQLEAQVRTQVEALAPGQTDEYYAAAVARVINESNEDQLINETYAELSVQAGSMKTGLAKSLDDYSKKPPKRLTKAEVANIESQLKADPAYIQLHDFFAIIMAFMVLSLLSLVLLPVKLLAGLLAFLGFRLQN